VEGGMEFEDHLAAAEAIVRSLERGEMRLSEAIAAFRKACEHVQEGERLLAQAQVEVERLVAVAGPDGTPRTEPLALN
jgi:exodeoxyribonuclease VII small subunit